MILGIGTDLTAVDRLEEAAKKERFVQRYVTQQERDYWSSRGKRAEVLAGLWAAKEAVAKALGSGFSGFGPDQIEVAPDALGRPLVHLRDGAKDRAKQLGIADLWVSISHDGGMAMAVALAQGGKEEEK